MKNIIKKLALISAVLLLNSCGSTARYTEELKTWCGKDVENLVTSLGSPSEIHLESGGKKSYTWFYVNNYLITGQYDHWSYRVKNSEMHRWCKSTFLVDKKNIIISFKWEGNSCGSTKKQKKGVALPSS